MYPKQLSAIFTPKRYAVCEAGTKTGKTVGCMVWLWEQALFGKAEHYWWIAPSVKQARIAFDRTKKGLPRGMFKANLSRQEITLPNGHMIHYLTGEKPDLLYGDDVGAAVLDEYTRLREEAWFAVRSTLTATRGPVRFIGNVRGKKNWGYRLARRAQTRPDWEYARITWRDAVQAGVLEADEIDSARADLPHAVFQELYEALASDEDTNPFGMERVRACVAKASRRKTAAWGWDLAKSVDFTCGIGFDRRMHWTQAEHWQRPWKETMRDILSLVGEVPSLVDSTGVGDAIVEMMQRRKRDAKIIGFKFTQSSRQQLLEGLRLAIHEQECTLPEESLDEFDAFEYEYSRTGGVKYVAAEGMHDDWVMGTALGVSCVRSVIRDPMFFLVGDEQPTGAEAVAAEIEKRQESIDEIQDAIDTDGTWGFDIDA